MRLAGAIARLGGAPLAVTRGTAGTLAAGVFTAGATTQLTLTAMVQPVSGRDLLRLPEGLRTRELVAVFTPTALRTTDEHAGTPADRFTWQGRTYEVQLVEEWSHLGGYRRAVAAKVEA